MKRKLLFLMLSLFVSGLTFGQTTCFPDAANYNTGSTNGTSFTQTSVIRTQSANAERGWARFNTSAIPDGDDIASVELHIYVSYDNFAYFKTMSIESDPLSGTASSVFTDCGNGTTYKTYSSNFPNPGWYTVDLGTTAATDLKNLLGSNWFAVGLFEYESFGTYYLTYDGWNETNVPYIVVSHAAPPACPDPTAPTETNITTTTADLGWTENGTAASWDIEWGATPYTFTGTPTVTGVTNPYTLTGLLENTEYTWKVRADCGSGSYSTWTGPGTFSTLCNAITSFPFHEDFENGGLIPDCWSQSFETGTTSWGFQAGGHNGHPAAPAGGSYNALLYNPSFTASVTKLITPALDLSGATFPHLIFKHAQALWPSDQDELRVYYKTSAGGTWTLLPGAEWTGNIPDWTTEMFALPDPSADYYIAFEGTAKYGYGVVIDDVRIEATPPVPLSNWAIYLGIFFIGTTMVFHFVRRRLA